MWRAIIAAAFVHCLFFAEYLPPLYRVHIPYDLEGYHYPLLDFAFRELREGRLPEWDSAIYCGIPLAGNVQAALLYPPTWLLFLLNAHKPSLPYRSLEIFILAHVWLAFGLAYRWFRSRGYSPLASWLGAAVFAYSGYMMTQLQHFGLVCGVAWWPAAFQAIDEAKERRSAVSLWKLAGASALVLLAGYPPLWAAFAVFALAYAASSGVLFRTAAALAFSLALAAVQLLPAAEANRLVGHFSHYGAGVRGIERYITFALPNFHAFGLHMPVQTNPGLDYWYLGAPGLLGILFSRGVRGAWAVACAALFFLTNPWYAISDFIERFPMISSALRSWYFMPGLTIAAALLSASGWQRILNHPRRFAPNWIAAAVILAAAAWSARLLLLWYPFDAVDFAAGPATAFDLAVALSLTAALAFVAAPGRMAAGVALAIFSLVELKAFGTSRRFNGTKETGVVSPTATMPGFDPDVFAQVRQDRTFRVAVDLDTGPWTNDFRHYGVSALQGFDPLLTADWRRSIESAGGKFISDRDFTIDPANHDLLRKFGVKYFVNTSDKPISGFRRLERPDGTFSVHELENSAPAYTFTGGGASVVEWTTNRRVFDVGSAGVVQLAEQWFPGWHARIDGDSATTYQCNTAFVCVNVPPGSHRVEFYFASNSLRLGAFVSLLAILVLAYWARRHTTFATSLQLR
jgi:hypothetical protein